jgi:hypothetical protein
LLNMAALRVVTRWIALGLCVGLLAACSTTKTAVRFQKPGADAGDQHRDESACLRSAIFLDDSGLILLPFELDRAAYQRCMEDRGYVAAPAATRP